MAYYLWLHDDGCPDCEGGEEAVDDTVDVVEGKDVQQAVRSAPLPILHHVLNLPQVGSCLNLAGLFFN